MVAKALSLITLVTLRVLVTLSSDMVASVELVITKLTIVCASHNTIAAYCRRYK